MKIVCTFVFLVAALACLCEAKNVTLTLLPDAVAKGAVCLDGSPAGYYYRMGSGSGAMKWILHMEGGGWCFSFEDCYNRSKTDLGSSKHWAPSAAGPGFLSDDINVNPDFYNWNVVYLKYCDGASFAGNVEAPYMFNKTNLYFRGRTILHNYLVDLMGKGLNSATDVILTGCSAGGLAVYFHADAVRERYFPKTVKFKAFADAGYFLDVRNISGKYAFRAAAQVVTKIHNISMGLNQDCVKDMAQEDLWKCFFPPYMFKYVKSIIFVLNSEYDTAQLRGIAGVPCFPPNCSDDVMKFIDNFREEFLNMTRPVFESDESQVGYFFDSCFVHCQTLYDDTWTKYSVSGQSMRETFADWYYERPAKWRLADCAYPCNKSCPKVHQVTELFSGPHDTCK